MPIEKQDARNTYLISLNQTFVWFLIIDKKIYNFRDKIIKKMCKSKKIKLKKEDSNKDNAIL